jgi:pimeloyl-ACP methyl ester carboxylesterase
MERRLKLAIAVIVALLALVGINMLIVDGKTRSATVTVPGGRILELPQGELQVVEHGPAKAPPVVLIHCYTCAIDWWDRMVPLLDRDHRVVAVDLLGHGGSEKPESGYDPEHQAEALAAALERLRVHRATVVGHSLGGAVGVALAQRHPDLVKRLAVIGTAPDDSFGGDHGLTASLAYTPLIGEMLWTIKPDFSVRDGLGVAFAPGFDVPGSFVEDVKRLTYSAYDASPQGGERFREEQPLGDRMKEAGQPLLAIMGEEEQLVDEPRRALAEYARAGARTRLIAGAGHSPNVERPQLIARLILQFARSGQKGIGSSVRDVTERGSAPQRSSRQSPERASGVRSATGDQ